MALILERKAGQAILISAPAGLQAMITIEHVRKLAGHDGPGRVKIAVDAPGAVVARVDDPPPPSRRKRA